MFFSKFENRTGFSALADSFYYQWFSIFRLFPILKICLNFSFIHKCLDFNEIVILLHFFGRLLCEYQHFFGRLLCEYLHFFGRLLCKVRFFIDNYQKLRFFIWDFLGEEMFCFCGGVARLSQIPRISQFCLCGWKISRRLWVGRVCGVLTDYSECSDY